MNAAMAVALKKLGVQLARDHLPDLALWAIKTVTTKRTKRGANSANERSTTARRRSSRLRDDEYEVWDNRSGERLFNVRARDLETAIREARTCARTDGHNPADLRVCRATSYRYEP
jgi:hypothetical protein